MKVLMSEYQATQNDTILQNSKHDTMIPFCQFASLLLVGLAPKPIAISTSRKREVPRFCFTKHSKKRLLKIIYRQKGFGFSRRAERNSAPQCAQ
jgi:hypothetical protein